MLPSPLASSVGTLRPPSAALPSGLAHLERELFRPRRLVRRSAGAEGILCLEGPGLVGEARLVARQIRLLFQQGVQPHDILVVLREVPSYAELLREVFAEYGIAADVEGAEPLGRNPAVATLLRLLRLPDEGWPFAAVTALLRSGYFRPAWPEAPDGAETAQYAEALLRLLGEPRGREAYMAAVRRWDENPPPGLEDEQAEESRRRRIHDLAKKCRRFLERFFHCWDGAPLRAPLVEHAAWLRGLAHGLGLERAAAEQPQDHAALKRLWDELAQCVRLEEVMHGAAHARDRAHFQRTLSALASTAGVARTPRSPDRVRVLSADLACALQAPYVFVLGLGERSFPRLTSADPLFDEPERQALKQVGLPIPCVGDMLPVEMLLFYQVVTSARRLLVLSYPAVDDKGQALLPSSFLTAVRDCFADGVLAVERRRMLIEGYDREVPLSAAEARVRAAVPLNTGGQVLARPPGAGPARIAEERLAEILATAQEVARQRFRAKEHTPYDGLLRDPAVVAEVRQKYGPQCILSPTALESYIACPYRFFVGHVLGLQILEEPSEELESTERGLAFHRALSRLHVYLKAQGMHQPDTAVDLQLKQQLEQAVREGIPHSGPAAAALWRLEGKRLQRAGARYRIHWDKFLDPWRVSKILPRPEYFEVSFGLPGREGEMVAGPLVIALDGEEVRVSGRIDRVDVAELPDGSLGFWVIDYKTGRGITYTASDLKEHRRLQLTLYALAVQEVLLAGRPARPLGLAYWLVTEAGPKVVLPTWPKRPPAWLDEAAAWEQIRAELRRTLVQLGQGIRTGQFPLRPVSEDCTQKCDFGQMCRISQSRAAVQDKIWSLSLPTT